MNYNLKGTGVPITDDLRNYLEKRLSTLDKFMRNDSGRVDVEVEYLESENKQYRAEFMLHTKEVYRATAKGSTLFEAIDIAAGELFGELTRSKKKRLTNIRQGAAKVKEFVRGWRNKL